MGLLSLDEAEEAEIDDEATPEFRTAIQALDGVGIVISVDEEGEASEETLDFAKMTREDDVEGLDESS